MSASERSHQSEKKANWKDMKIKMRIKYRKKVMGKIGEALRKSVRSVTQIHTETFINVNDFRLSGLGNIILLKFLYKLYKKHFASVHSPYCTNLHCSCYFGEACALREHNRKEEEIKTN